jgi:hypothetical protein
MHAADVNSDGAFVAFDTGTWSHGSAASATTSSPASAKLARRTAARFAHGGRPVYMTAGCERLFNA